MVGEANLVADLVPYLRAEFLSDAGGEGAGGDAAWLGVADGAEDAPAEFEADLGELGCFTRAGLAADDYDLVVADEVGDLLAFLADWEVRWGVVYRWVVLRRRGPWRRPSGCLL